MEQTIIKSLKGKTRVLVTHSVQHLPLADWIYVMNEGKIEQQGTYDQIKDTELVQKFNELQEIAQEDTL